MFLLCLFHIFIALPIVYKEIKLTLSKREVSLLVMPSKTVTVSHVATLENQLPIPDLNS